MILCKISKMLHWGNLGLVTVFTPLSPAGVHSAITNVAWEKTFRDTFSCETTIHFF